MKIKKLFFVFAIVAMVSLNVKPAKSESVAFAGCGQWDYVFRNGHFVAERFVTVVDDATGSLGWTQTWDYLSGAPEPPCFAG